MPHKEKTKEDEVRETIKEVVGTFLTGRGNDEDEIGMASAWKANTKDTYDRHRTWFDVLMSQTTTLNAKLINSLGQMMNTINIADKNLVHQSNIANKQTTLDAGVLADESVVTDQEAFNNLVNMLTAKVMAELGTKKE